MSAKKSRPALPPATRARKPFVLLPVLMQDPSVAGEAAGKGAIIHPVVVKDPAGFTIGPTCRRVAVVDLDFHTGKFGAPARFEPKPTIFRGVTGYHAAVPTRVGARLPTWSHVNPRVALDALGSRGYHDSFLKVSVCGIVLRTLGLVQDRVALGREVKWAFPGEQLLVVPRAGALENAFYHRESRSLQFYFGELAGQRGRTVYSALSQDIVAHETTHAIVDGIAPDLYDAMSAESLAIHEGLADITAALLSMRNRESFGQAQAQSPEALRDLQQSSRFSRIAEEFGKWRGHGDALRDVCNRKTLDPDEPDDARRVDTSSPHSLSEVLSGILFDVFRNEVGALPDDPKLREEIRINARQIHDPARWQAAYAVNRLLSLIYKGLDWLPPGEASFAELIRAMVVADQAYLPRHPAARGMLLRCARERHVLRGKLPKDATLGLVEGNHDNLFSLLRSSSEARREFVDRHRETLGIPPAAPVRVVCRMSALYEPPLIPDPTRSESFFLSPVVTRRELAAQSELLLVKLRWKSTEPNDLGGAWGRMRRFKAGATVVLDPEGCVRAVLRAGADPRQVERRSGFLKRVLLTGDGAVAGKPLGPDGLPLQTVLRTELRRNILSVSGGFQALHIAGDEP